MQDSRLAVLEYID